MPVFRKTANDWLGLRCFSLYSNTSQSVNNWSVKINQDTYYISWVEQICIIFWSVEQIFFYPDIKENKIFCSSFSTSFIPYMFCYMLCEFISPYFIYWVKPNHRQSRPWSSRIKYFENNRQNLSRHLLFLKIVDFLLVICQNNKQKIDYFRK